MVAAGRRGSGRVSDFTPEQNRELRRALRRLRDEREIAQAEIGRKLGLTQQTVGRLLNADDAGFSYGSATRLAYQLGYDGVDTFFRAKGVALRRSA